MEETKKGALEELAEGNISDEEEHITVKFKKYNKMITLESIDDDEGYDNIPLIKIDDEGNYIKQPVNLSEVLTINHENPTANDIDNRTNPFEYGTAVQVSNQQEEDAEEDDTEEERLEDAARIKAEEDAARIKAEEAIDLQFIEQKERQPKQSELYQAFEQAAEEEQKKKEQLINEPEKKEIKKPMSLIDELKNNKLFKQRQQDIQGGKKNRTKKSIKAGKKKSKKVRFVMTKKGRKNKKNRTRR